MKASLILIILAVLVTSSCKHSDPPPASAVFLTVSGFTNTYGASDAWVFATDKNGTLLDVQQNVTGTVQLKSLHDVPDSVTLTFFYFANYTQSGGYPSNFIVSSYDGIPKNSAVVSSLDPTPFTPPTSIGNALITVQGYHKENNPLTTFSFSDGYKSYFGTDHTGDLTHEVSIDLQPDHPDILASGYDGETPVYAWFNGVDPNDQLTKPFSEFTTFPHTIELDFDGQVFGLIKGYYQADFMASGYTLSVIDMIRSQSPGFMPTLGYLDGFDRYSTTVGASSNDPGGNRSVFYQKTGSVNPSISLPSHEFTFVNKDIGDFAFTFAGTYDYKTSSWQFSDNQSMGISWTIFSAKGATPKITGIPTEIASRHLNFDFSKLTHYDTQLFQSLDGFTYQDYITESLGGTPKTPREFYTFDCQ